MAERGATSLFSECTLLLVPGTGTGQAAIFKTFFAVVRSSGGVPMTVEEATAAWRKKSEVRVTHVVSGRDTHEATVQWLQRAGVAAQRLVAVPLVKASWLQASLRARTLLPLEDHRFDEGQLKQAIGVPKAAPRPSPALPCGANGAE